MITARILWSTWENAHGPGAGAVIAALRGLCAEKGGPPGHQDVDDRERRVDELQEALRVAMDAKARCEQIMREIATLDDALNQACEAIYNATIYDPSGELDEGIGGDDAR